ncbi:hypothetical protein J1TS5_03750 [Paenibacillus macerans]|uniref:hypothetical protein n=1 Tax=Paenibacillus macerans TaxID=44252 RepID=UPI001B2A96EC|nr:hypothetical protein [Paenibacillus macerans]GIP08205.1 hypothetical protein J1TS5_03750 [Paenibacillus macerans]
MDINDIVEHSLESIARRIKNAPSQKLAELAENNVSRSTFAITATFSVLTEAMKSELISLVQELSQTKIKLRNISSLRTKLNYFIKGQYKEHEEYLTKLNIFNKFSGQSINDFIRNEIEDVTSTVELKILILERNLNERRWQIIWDVSKMGLSAIIGGLIGAYLKNLIG